MKSLIETVDLDDDDRPIGRVLSRREILALFGAAGIGAVAAACAPGATGTASLIASAAPSSAATAAASPSAALASAVPAASPSAVAVLPSCIVKPALTEGPYFVDEKLNRSDIRSDPPDNSVQAGVPLTLTFAVSKLSGTTCVPFANALVDVWHCNALGAYSDVNDNTFGNQSGKKFLRGYQVTDANGMATFTTIYPGWYQGRTVHIHFKIRTDAASAQGLEFTSQLFFDDTLSDTVFASAPYAQKGARGTRNATDDIFSDQLILDVQGNTTAYTSTFEIGVQTS